MADARLHPTLGVRAAVGFAVGIVVGVIVGPFLGVAAAFLAGWAALCITSVTWILVSVWSMDAEETKSHATSEDPGRAVARIIALVGSFASLGAVAVVLLQTRNTSELETFLLAGIAVVAVAGSWALIQVDYMLRLAHVYYREPVGGISFNQQEDPMYTDFVYVAVGLGMTYQIADTNLRTNEMRRIVIFQTLLAYLFGAVILATVINLVTGLG